MKRFGKIFVRLVVATVIASGLLVVVVQNDPWIKKQVQDSVESLFSSLFECQFSCHVSSINIFMGKLVLDCVHVRSLDGVSWQWNADEMRASLSLLPYITQGSGALDLVVSSVDVRSSVAKNGLAIQNHLMLLGKKPPFDVPVSVRSIELRDLFFALTTDDASNYGEFFMQGKLDFGSEALKMAYHVRDGCISVYSQKLVSQVQSDISVILPFEDSMNSACDIKGHATVSGFCQTKAVSFIGSYKNTVGVFECADDTKNMFISFQNNKLDAHFSCAIPCIHGQVKTRILCDITGNLDTLHSWQGHIDFTDNYYGAYELPAIRAVCSSATGSIQCDVTCQDNQSIHPEFSCTIHSLTSITGRYFLPLYGGIYGSCAYSGEECVIDGKCGGSLFGIRCGLDPYFYIKSCDYYKNDEHVIVGLGTADGFQISLSYAHIRDIGAYYGYDIPGEGDIMLSGSYTSVGPLFSVKLRNGSIRIPSTYFLIQQFDASFVYDYKKRFLQAYDVDCLIHGGNIFFPMVNLLFDSSYNVSYVYAPCSVKNAVLVFKKDFLAEVHAVVCTTYDAQRGPRCEGTIVIDNASVRNNVFSAEFQKELFVGAGQMVAPWQDAILALTIVTRAPVIIKTPFLQTAARCKLLCAGRVTAPEVSGKIELFDGSLHFPYQPLYITRGRIEFVPQHSFDPFIELSARNVIKNYAVDMTITGSAHDPHIHFSSSPFLEQENILGLLLGGSEDGSLAFALPKPVMESVESLMFGTAATSSRMQEYLRSYLKPLRNIRFVPRFTDQSGRGGLRGAVAIEVNDRLKGMIEQNFSLSEDTRLEVEYALSDDIKIRGVKDERGDVGAEVETRWKF